MFKVLLVDDEPFVREGIKALIPWEEYGYMLCGEAENGEEALHMIKKQVPHVVITDIKMPVFDGLELIKRVRDEIQEPVKFIILSGYNEFKFAQTAMQYDVKNYILKPIDEEDFVQTLKNVRTEIEEELKLKNEYELGLRAMTSHVIQKLVRGENGKDVVERAKVLLNAEDDMEFQYILLQIERFGNWSNEMDDTELQAKENTVRRCIEDHMGAQGCHVILEDQKQFAIVRKSRASGVPVKDERKLFIDLQKDLREEVQSNISVFVGKKVKEIRKLRESYRSALVAMNYKFFKGENSIIFYEEVKSSAFTYDLKEVISFPILIEAVENASMDDIYNHIEAIFSKLYIQQIAPEMIKICVHNFAMEILKVISEMEGDMDMVLQEYPIFDLDIQEFTFNELKEFVIEFSIRSAEYIKTLRERQSMGIIAKVEDYINHNFRSDLTLKGIADHFHINPVYLGQLFKKSFGTYFNDYLHNLRIEEAKKLLRRTEMKIYEIAESVGYHDTDYFINKFEKKVHLTPSQYKKRVMGNE